jgi:sulfhydrogenase subunit beta (sulfur reductase)
MNGAVPDTSGDCRAECFLQYDQLQSLLDALIADGRTVIGPKIEQQAIVYGEIRRVQDLPRGWTDDQAPGVYRLKPRNDDACFGYVVGPHSWKQFLFPPVATVATADKTVDGWTMETPLEAPPRYAFLGVRACELAAIRIQDRVFLAGSWEDPIYKARRDASLIIAVNCTQAAPTCFCTSMNSGPRCESGFDLAMTELVDGFVIESDSVAGNAILDMLDTQPATESHLSDSDTARQQAVNQISRQLDTTEIRDLLLGNLDHARWDEVATRCLSCTNCTMVCPTCFCSTVKDVPNMTGDHVDRQREWDSCFNIDFSYMNGGVVRSDVRSRYRQWLTHKLGSWHDQFGQSGCVGCGRCITWCPPGIDLTEEVAAIRDSTDRRDELQEIG